MHEGDRLLFCCSGCVLVFHLLGQTGDGARADWFLAKLGLAALLSGNVMMFQSLTYFGSLQDLGAEVVNTSSWIMFCCAFGVFALLGVPMLRIAVGAWRQGHLTLETLIGFGALAAIGFSASQTLRAQHVLYYDSGTMVLVFVTLGQYLDAEARRRALALLSPLLHATRRPARLCRDDREIDVAPQDVRAGETVSVRAGEEIPVDGTVLSGSADVHEPLLNGEWRPRLVRVGDRVSAGSTTVDGALTVTASGLADTLSERLQRFAIEARNHRSGVEAIVDRVVAVFIPAVIVIAIGSACAWGLAGQWARGLQAALAVLVVACPCALGIATPMATTIALSRAIARGCLVRSGAVLQALSRVRAVAFDKTGTITVGQPRVGAFCAAESAILDADTSLMFAAAVEREVSHPFAHAMVAAAVARGIALPLASEVRLTAGGGAEAIVRGRHVAIGKRAWLAARAIALPEAPAPDSGGSIVAMAIDGRFAGEWSLEDLQRPEAHDVLTILARMGITCQLLSGDRRAVVQRVAASLGFAAWGAELSPRDKLVRVGTMRVEVGPVAMLGDGVNDAPALGAADVGIAFGPAADLARDTADVAILREDLNELPRLLELARATFRIVRQNLAWAFGYNVVAIALAAFGVLRPVYAAAAMVLSSLCVVGNSLRLARTPASGPGAARTESGGLTAEP